MVWRSGWGSKVEGVRSARSFPKPPFLTTRELQTCTFQGPVASNRIPRKDAEERKERKTIVVGKEKRREILGSPPFRASTLRGIHHPSKHPPPFQASTLRGIQLSHHPFLGLAPSPHRTSRQFGPQPKQVKRAGLKGGGGGKGEGGSNGGTKGRVGGERGASEGLRRRSPFFCGVCLVFFCFLCVSKAASMHGYLCTADKTVLTHPTMVSQ